MAAPQTDCNFQLLLGNSAAWIFLSKTVCPHIHNYEFLSKLWSPYSNNWGSHSNSQRKKAGNNSAIKLKNWPAGGYFISSLGQRQNGAIWKELGVCSIWNSLQAIPPAWAPTPTVEMLGLIYVTVMVFRLGLNCFAESKSKWVTQKLFTDLTAFRQAGPRLNLITRLRENVCDMTSITLWITIDFYFPLLLIMTL